MNRPRKIYELLYQWLMLLIYPLFWIAYGIGQFFLKDLNERFGFYSKNHHEMKTIWIHAASVGEVNAIRLFCQHLKKKNSSFEIILTTTTNSGKAFAQKLKIADHVFLAPLDFEQCLKRSFGALNPSMILIVETEFWPNWLMYAREKSIPVILINGRISEKKFKSYYRFRFLFESLLNSFEKCLVQTSEDQNRLSHLGVISSNIYVVGQMKYDLEFRESELENQFKLEMGIQSSDHLITLGSIREEEIELIVPILPTMLDISSNIRIVLAPRHLSCLDELILRLKKMDLKFHLRTGNVNRENWRILILNTLGELSKIYACSCVCFVGGTLVPIGGHNLMEPALVEKPVCFGPFISNFKEAADILQKYGGGFQIQTIGELPQVISQILKSDFAQIGKQAKNAIQSLSGATEKTLKIIEDSLFV
jgi:3-deoxy-D-manno-octulosonic-acid transferase